jgi:hypothetical protein
VSTAQLRREISHLRDRRPSQRLTIPADRTVTQVLLQNGLLRVASGLPEAETLKRELLNFRVKIDPKTAHDSYEHWRESDHDDLVLAVSMAAWFRQHWNRHLDAGLPRRLRHTSVMMGVSAM